MIGNNNVFLKTLKAPRVMSRFITVARHLNPKIQFKAYKLNVQRKLADEILRDLSLCEDVQCNGTVLVDAQWDNPNYWIRYSILRSALGLGRAREIGILGPFRAKYCRQSLTRLGVKEIISIVNMDVDISCHREHATCLLGSTHSPDDIMHWELPEEVPPNMIYDALIKRQRVACVDLNDPKLIDLVTEALIGIAGARRLFDYYDFSLVILSHVAGMYGAALAWIALKRGIPVILIYGQDGLLKFSRLTRPMDIYDRQDRMTLRDLSFLSEKQSEALAETGASYLAHRRGGKTSDISARYSYQKRNASIDRSSLAAWAGWDQSNKIIGVYASNWFDYPHSLGMSHFRDFLDWVNATLEIAVDNDQINWLFKGHPTEEWYGGPRLRDMMPNLSEKHIAIAKEIWNGSDLIDCLDGVITYHGTAGIEFAAAGKAVLLADRGFYHDLGFAKWSRSRKEYLDNLKREWWSDLDLKETTRRARIFAGSFYGKPWWQGNFIMEDDSKQWDIYQNIPAFIENNRDIIEKEIQTLRDWFTSDHAYYHTHKMIRAEKYSA